MVTDEDREQYRGLAEYLAAAYVAYRMRLKSIDRVLKEYVRGHPRPIGDAWINLAKSMTEGEMGMLGQ